MIEAGVLRKLLLLVFFTFVWNIHLSEGGSPCPGRESIYPCYCTAIQQSKRRTFTIVTCRYVPQTGSLSQIFPTLRTMVIDRFILYDSFWEASKLGEDSTNLRRLPQNWMSLLNIKEFEIADSLLSYDFPCDVTAGCPNVELTSLTIRNSSTENGIVSLCKQGDKMMYWTSCMSKLRHFSFDNNKLKSFEKNLFPTVMHELSSLNLSHNHIRKIGPGSFSQLPNLQTLDLSYNMISDLSDGIFGNEKMMKLAYLDLSWNFIKELSPDIFTLTPQLVTFRAQSNQISKLPEEHWRHLSAKIKLIDLEENPLECDCHLIWVNCTLKVHTNILGFCITEGYENTPLRRVAKYMSQRCDENDVIQERENGTKRNACQERLKMVSNNVLSPSSSYSSDRRAEVLVPVSDTKLVSGRPNRRRKNHNP